MKKIIAFLLIFVFSPCLGFTQNETESSNDNVQAELTPLKPNVFVYDIQSTNISKSRAACSAPFANLGKLTFELGLGFGIGYPLEIKNETLKKLAVFNTFRGGLLAGLLYTPNHLFGTGIEAGYYTMTAGAGIGNIDGRIEFRDYPIRFLLRLGYKYFYLEPYGGIIYQQYRIYGKNVKTQSEQDLITIPNPFNAEAGCKIIFGGVGKFFIEASYVWGILYKYPRIGVGCSYPIAGSQK